MIEKMEIKKEEEVNPVNKNSDKDVIDVISISKDLNEELKPKVTKNLSKAKQKGDKGKKNASIKKAGKPQEKQAVLSSVFRMHCKSRVAHRAQN